METPTSDCAVDAWVILRPGPQLCAIEGTAYYSPGDNVYVWRLPGTVLPHRGRDVSG